MTLALVAWAVIPFSQTQVIKNMCWYTLYIAVSSLGYMIIMGGWA